MLGGLEKVVICLLYVRASKNKQRAKVSLKVEELEAKKRTAMLDKALRMQNFYSVGKKLPQALGFF